MYTILWTDPSGEDRWDRFSNRAAVLDFLKKNNLLEDEDVTIFTHEADDYAVSPQELVSDEVL